MISILRQMILCITAAALFGAVVQALTKDGAVKEVIQMAVGILLILSLVLPLRRGFKLPDIVSLFPQREAIQQDAQELYTQALLQQFQTDMQEYIQDIMHKQDCTGTVSVSVCIDADDKAAIEHITIQLEQGNAQALHDRLTDSLELDADTVVIR